MLLVEILDTHNEFISARTRFYAYEPLYYSLTPIAGSILDLFPEVQPLNLSFEL